MGNQIISYSINRHPINIFQQLVEHLTLHNSSMSDFALYIIYNLPTGDNQTIYD